MVQFLGSYQRYFKSLKRDTKSDFTHKHIRARMYVCIPEGDFSVDHHLLLATYDIENTYIVFEFWCVIQNNKIHLELKICVTL